VIVVAVVMTRRDLDAWARALGLDNDDDAAGQVRRLFGWVSSAAIDLNSAYLLLGGGSDRGLSEHVHVAFNRSTEATSELADVLLAFERHERGRWAS
jgi:hypothetical protein